MTACWGRRRANASGRFSPMTGMSYNLSIVTLCRCLNSMWMLTHICRVMAPMVRSVKDMLETQINECGAQGCRRNRAKGDNLQRCARCVIPPVSAQTRLTNLYFGQMQDNGLRESIVRCPVTGLLSRDNNSALSNIKNRLGKGTKRRVLGLHSERKMSATSP